MAPLFSTAIRAALLIGLGLTGAAKAATAVGPCPALERRAAALTVDDAYQANSLLQNAAKEGCEQLAITLLDRGTNIEGRDRVGATPLMRAAEAGKDALVTLLLSRGADINARAIAGSTPLFFAAEADKFSTIRLLLDKKADVNAPGRGGIRPLAAAAYKGNSKALALLIAGGADMNAVDESGKSAIVYAASMGFPESVKLLLESGVDVNRKYDHNLTVLMWASGYSTGAGVDDVKKIITMLLERGANLDDKDDRGKTARDIAQSLHHDEVLEMLNARAAQQGLSANGLKPSP